MEEDQLGKKIYENFTKSYEKLSVIEEIGIIPTNQTANETNKSPIYIENNCIGIEKWAVKLLYMYTYKYLMLVRDKKVLLDDKTTLQLSRCVVLFCADCTTVWNIRKKIFSQNQSDLKWIQNELKITKLSVRIHPKSFDAFAHRRWVLTFLSNLTKKQNNETFTDTIQAVKNELSFSGDAANWHSCNYNAWSHRVWVLDKFILTKLKIHHDKNFDIFLEILKSDFETVLKWIEVNVSDYCGMSYLLHILINVTTHFNNSQTEDNPFHFVINLWDKILHTCTDLIILHSSYHEALWYLRKGLFLNFYKMLFKSNCSANLLDKFCYKKEIVFCDKFKDSNSHLVENYLKFLDKFVSPLSIK